MLQSSALKIMHEVLWLMAACNDMGVYCDLQKPDIIADLIFREIPLLNIQTTVAS